MRNSESTKQQKHPHTTGRKSHPRLRKEMVIYYFFDIISVQYFSNSKLYHILQEDKMKQPVSKIDLWDEAHKKKNGSYANKNVQKLMVFFSSTFDTMLAI